MPDKFEELNIICKDKSININIVCGDSFYRVYKIEGAKEVIFQSACFNYQIPLVKLLDDWNLSFTSQQTQIIEEGSYNYTIKAVYDNDEIKTLQEGIITFHPSIFPLYKTYPIVIRDNKPTEDDNKYGVPTLWYDKKRKELYILENNINKIANWIKISNQCFIYQNIITKDFKFQGDTTIFSFLQIYNQNITVLKGTYDKLLGKTSYNINLENIIEAEYLLYIDKSIELLNDISINNINEEYIFYKFIYNKNNKEKIKDLEARIIFLENNLTEEQLKIIKRLINSMIKDAQFPDLDD